ncbi:MAG: hypothetical protein M3081_02675 [Gemmatimonadota bacterium]|nr:hypothetical protein [Gemmatimonadota bacterium]
MPIDVGTELLAVAGFGGMQLLAYRASATISAAIATTTAIEAPATDKSAMPRHRSSDPLSAETALPTGSSAFGA